MKHPVEYGNKILSGEIPACEFVRLSVQRHFNDLERDWDYYFDERLGLKPIEFVSNLNHFKGKWAGQKLIPAPWQSWALYVFFGWQKKDGSGRRFQDLYIEVPRKNGKTTFIAAVSLYHMIMDNENAPEIYTVANNRDQAKECLTATMGIIKKTPYLKEYLKVRAHDILCSDNMGKMKSLAANYDSLDGLNTSMGIFDEVHEYKDWELVRVITSSMGARENPITAMITTAGFNKTYPCYENRQMVINVLRGVIVREDLMGLIYTIDDGDNWKDETIWAKANPNIGDSPSWDHIRKEATKAINQNTHEVSFKTKHLNIWTDASQVWVKDDDWMNCVGEDIDLEGCECWGGLDIAASVDINALVLLFLKDGVYYVKPHFWIPERKVREKEDRVNYWKWKEDGLLNIMPGDALDDEFMARDILKIFAKYKIKGVAFDRYYSGGLVGRLDKAGFPMDKLHAYGQGYVSMSGPVRELERRVYLKTIAHDGNPILRWMLSNISISMDAAGNVKFDKSKSIDKIDGMVALAMAIAMEMGEEHKEEFTGKILIL